MDCFELKNDGGFSVVMESQGWRLALHCYQEEVNGVQAVKNWGIHCDSKEGFVLLEGKGLLLLKDRERKMHVREMEQGMVYMVAEGEHHAIVLFPNAKVFIVENQDMSNTVQEQVRLEEQEAFGQYLEQMKR